MVHDGYFMGDVLGLWEGREAFTDFWARQSDFTCSGLDGSEGSAIFRERSPPYDINNQRITKERLEAYLTRKEGN